MIMQKMPNIPTLLSRAGYGNSDVFFCNTTSITSIREAAAHFLPVVGARDTMALTVVGETPQFGSRFLGHAEPHDLFA